MVANMSYQAEKCCHLRENTKRLTGTYAAASTVPDLKYICTCLTS